MIQQTKKLRLDEITVDSFVTSTVKVPQTIRGGDFPTEDDAPSCARCTNINCLKKSGASGDCGGGYGSYVNTGCNTCAATCGCGSDLGGSQAVNVGCSGPDQIICQ
ncbi:MAG: hypothetical protein H9535_08325 [Ignavibacteria bacterium]|nr:hypothetical protein [Ignavibacteria bacterium]